MSGKKAEQSEALNAQIEELTKLIAMQQQKMANLENKLHEKVATPNPPTAPSPRSKRRRTAIPDDVHLLEKFEIQTNYTIAFSKVMMIGKTTRTTTSSDLTPVVIVVDTAGVLYVYDSIGRLSASVSLGHAPGVELTAVAADSFDAQFPTVVSAAKDGSVHVTAVRRVRSKARGVTEIVAAPMVGFRLTNGLPSNITSGEATEGQCPSGMTTEQCAATQPYVTALTMVVRSKNGCYLYAGDTLGRITKVLCHSGRRLGELTLPVADSTKPLFPVSTLILNRGSLAATRDNEIFIIDSQKMVPVSLDCELPATISDLRFDERLGWQLIAQSDTGNLFYVTLNSIRAPNGSKNITRTCSVLPLDDDVSSDSVVTGLGTVKGFFLSVNDCTLKIFNNSATNRMVPVADLVESISYVNKGCVPSSTTGYVRRDDGRMVTVGLNTKGTTLHVYNQPPPTRQSKGMLGAITSFASSGITNAESALTHVLVSYNSFKTSTMPELNPISLVTKAMQKKPLTNSKGSFSHGVIVLYTSNLKYVRPTSPLIEMLNSNRMLIIIAAGIVMVFWKRIFGGSKGGILGKTDRNKKFRSKHGRGNAAFYDDDSSLNY